MCEDISVGPRAMGRFPGEVGPRGDMGDGGCVGDVCEGADVVVGLPWVPWTSVTWAGTIPGCWVVFQSWRG